MKKIIATLFLLVLSIAAAAQSPPAKELTLKDIHGRTLRLSGYKGKVVLLNFWATWCVPCRTEIPDLIKLQKEYHKQGLRIIGITYPPEKLSEVHGFVRRLRMNYPVALGTKATKSLFTASETLPLTVIIDREGIVRDVIEGIMYPDEFQEKVKPLLSSNGNQSPNRRKGSGLRFAILS